MFVRLNRHDHHIQLAGSRQAGALVLLHSLGTSAAIWQRQIQVLSEKHHIVAPDFRGHGLSEQSAEPLTCDILASDVLALLDHLEIEKFALAGISLGGVVAQIVAARAGKRVSGLVIFDSYVKAADPAMWRDRAAKVRAEGLASISDGVLSLWMTGNQVATVDGRGLGRMLECASDEGYAAGCDALAGADCTALASSIACPAVVAYGSEDRAVPRAVAETLVAAIPGAVLAEIPDAGHLPLLHQADVCTAILERGFSEEA